MSLIYNDNNLLLWRIEESLSELEQLVTEGDRLSAARFASPERKRQHLAWRAALRTAVPEGEVAYDANGAPYIECVASSGRLAQPAAPAASLRGAPATKQSSAAQQRHPERSEGSQSKFGVSHTSELAAVIVGGGAVDVERMDRDVSKARSRFISEAEEQLPESRRPDFGVAVWCAKEVLYKLSGRKELDLLRDIAITHSDLAHGRITGAAAGVGAVTMSVIVVGEWLVVWGDGSGVRDVAQPAAQQRHCEERSDEAIQKEQIMLDCFAPKGARNDGTSHYPKKYRLAGKKAVDEIFAKGRGGVVPPLRWLVVIEPSEEAGLRTLVSVPKKLHKRAVRRNVLKRRMREAVRLSGAPLREACLRHGVRVSLALLYTTKDIVDYHTINAALEQILKKVEKRVISV